MKKPGKLFPLFLLCCMLIFATGCGTNKNNQNQDDMANNASQDRTENNQVGENNAQTGTEAFDANGANDNLNNSATTNGNQNNTGTMNDNDNITNDTGNMLDDAGDAAGNIIDDAGNAVGDVVDDIGNGIQDMTDDVTDHTNNTGVSNQTDTGTVNKSATGGR